VILSTVVGEINLQFIRCLKSDVPDPTGLGDTGPTGPDADSGLQIFANTGALLIPAGVTNVIIKA
jgi:hypothetical protein